MTQQGQSRKNVTVRLAEEKVDELDNEASDHGVSRAEYIRNLIESRHEPDEVDAELDRLQDEITRLQNELDESTTELERVRREKRQILEQREENQQLTRYVEREKSLQERRLERQDAPAWQRAKWWLLGRDDGS
ncbi:plasmid mobilization protein [Haladaptatus salinisoli]|uniref:plasmid mobilization protein n=1 Tax=Haladaptatus salinisoli TaxID=2884876 RepID=UPI001D09CC42|nr:ribbon-helix-helix protein, CopG family [Haladaptatus salinisoli]